MTVDTLLFTFDGTTNPPILKVYTFDNSKMGNYSFVIRARFDIPGFVYTVDSNVFQIEV